MPWGCFFFNPTHSSSIKHHAMNSNEEQKILTSVNHESFLHEWGLKWEGKCKIVSFYHCLFVWLLSLARQPYNHVVSLLSLSVQFHFNSGPLLAWETYLQCQSKGDIKQTKMYIQLKILYITCVNRKYEREIIIKIRNWAFTLQRYTIMCCERLYSIAV